MGINPKLTISVIVYLVMEKSLSEYFSEMLVNETVALSADDKNKLNVGT